MHDPIVFQYDPDRTIADIDPEQITGFLVGDVWYPVTLGERVDGGNVIQYHIGAPESVTVVSA